MAAKLAITSDLHFPVTPTSTLQVLAQEMARFGPSAVILAGNLAESLPEFTLVLKLFRRNLDCPIWVLPGDQDFFARPPYDSRRLWRELLPGAVAASACDWLEGRCFLVEDVAVAGSAAWYDYSSADPSLGPLDMDFAQKKYQHNADALRIDWEWSDPEFASMLSVPFVATLEQLQQAPNVRHIVAVTHFPVLEEQLARDRASPDRLFSSAYLGNLKLGQQILERSKVSHIISGHSSEARQATVSRAGAQPVDVRVVGSQYEKPVWVRLTVG